MELIINGEPRQVPAALNVEELLRHLELPADRVAVELNRRIVRREEWTATPLADHDRLEIVQFVGGG
ncbi:MAG TPA: sulfur carrier protein ThiS [Terriglobia bacterium]|nr:sulfur carrier protein ThiS [Terriglobia bacterium]